jgi:hypothetical protein
MNFEKKIRELFKLTLFIFVVPLVSTIILSKVIGSKHILSYYESFTLHNALSNQIDLSCNKNICTTPDENVQNKTIEVFYNLSGNLSFKSLAEDKNKLVEVHKKLVAKANEFLDSSSCYKSPESFSTKILIKNFEFDFLTPQISQVLYDFVYLSRGDEKNLFKQQSKLICDRYLDILRNQLISNIGQTYEQEYNKLKLIFAFYFGLVFLFLIVFYVYPKYKGHFKR